MSRGLKIGLASAVVVGAVVVGVIYFSSQGSKTPSTGAVRDEIEKQIANPLLKVTEITPTMIPTAAGSVEIHYRAVAESKEALFEKLETSDVLRNELKLDLDAWENARKTLAGPGSARIMELAKVKTLDDTLLQTTFLKEVSPKGQKVNYEGQMRATKTSSGWQLENVSANSTGEMPQGQARSTFAGRLTVVSDPSEMEKLRRLAGEQAEVPNRIEQARLAYVQEKEAEQEKAMAGLLEGVVSGTMFAGTATPGTGAPVRLYLELTTVRTKEKQVVALLRNDGSWTDARTFQGTIAPGPDDGTLTIALGTQRIQAIRKAGPLLERSASWQVALKCAGGKLTGREGEWEYALTRLSASEAAAARQEVEGDAGPLREATAPGRAYRVTIRSKAGADSFEGVLRFSRQEDDAAAIALTLEPLGRPNLQRPYHGTIINSRARAEGWPLRLETRAREAVKGATAHALLASREDVTINCRLADGRLVGETKDFTCEFAPLSADELARADAEKAQREKRILALIKDDATFSGQASSPNGAKNERLRLRITKVEPGGASVDAVLESLEVNGVARDFHGTLDLFDGRLVLTTNGRSRGRNGGLVHFPAFVDGKAEMVISLTVNGDKLTGDIKPPDWRLEF